jgi:hypothetical protein
MPEINFGWIHQQLESSKVEINVGNSLIALLKTWEGQELTTDQAKKVLDYFSKLALGVNVYDDTPQEEIWVPAEPGRLVVGDEVRVLKDAFTDKVGVLHNGRRGKIVGIRYGDIIFKSTDNKTPDLNGVHYSPYKLEKRIR